MSEGSVDVCYNPLNYAWDAHEAYLRKMGGCGARTVILGMNPGPHGMGQMGIPFAATSVVRDLLGITGIPVDQPEVVDSRRPVVGLEYPREEVSGTRLWGLLAEYYGDVGAIASSVFLVNHCPLMLFSGPRATNITPDTVAGPTAPVLLARGDRDEAARQFPLTLIIEASPDRMRSGRKSVTTSTTLRANYHLYSRGNAIVCVCLRMQCYFITPAVDILYGMLCVRGLADYGTERIPEA